MMRGFFGSLLTLAGQLWSRFERQNFSVVCKPERMQGGVLGGGGGWQNGLVGIVVGIVDQAVEAAMDRSEGKRSDSGRDWYVF
jgi:hypothetical protein